MGDKDLESLLSGGGFELPSDMSSLNGPAQPIVRGNRGGYFADAELTSPIHLDYNAIAEALPGGRASPHGESVFLYYEHNGSTETLMRLDLDNQGRIKGVNSGVEPAILAPMLEAAMGKEIFTDFASRIPSDSDFSLSYSETEYEAANARLEQNRQNRQLVDELNGLPDATPYAFSINPDIARNVLQGEIMEVRAEDAQHILGTYGADPCVIVAAYSPSQGKVVMSHVDALVDTNRLKSEFDRRFAGADDIEIHFAGGNASSVEQTGEILRAFSEDGRYSLQTVDVVQGAGGASFAIDAATGVVSSDIDHTSLDAGSDFEGRLQMVGFRGPFSPDLTTPRESVFRHPEPDRLPPESPSAGQEIQR